MIAKNWVLPRANTYKLDPTHEHKIYRVHTSLNKCCRTFRNYQGVYTAGSNTDHWASEWSSGLGCSCVSECCAWAGKSALYVIRCVFALSFFWDDLKLGIWICTYCNFQIVHPSMPFRLSAIVYGQRSQSTTLKSACSAPVTSEPTCQWMHWQRLANRVEVTLSTTTSRR